MSSFIYSSSEPDWVNDVEHARNLLAQAFDGADLIAFNTTVYRNYYYDEEIGRLELEDDMMYDLFLDDLVKVSHHVGEWKFEYTDSQDVTITMYTVNNLHLS